MGRDEAGTGAAASPAEAWRRRLVECLVRDLDEVGAEVREAPADAGRMEVLAFGLGDEGYGVDIGEVAEILLPRSVTPVPRTPPFVLGVASLRGAVLPVLDLGLRLGLRASERPRSSRILVLRDGEDRVGFWVDRVRGVVRFSSHDVEATDFASAVDPRFLRGVGYDRSGNLVAVLAAAALCDFRVEGA